jgi:DNA-binding Lrp family transcriptional regulator
MRYTVKEFAKLHGISESAARARLEKLVSAGRASKRTYTETVYRRVRGYSGKYMPCNITQYTVEE